MSEEVKYIVIKDRSGNETPIIFGPNFQHSEIADRICCGEDVVSAGFVGIQDLEEYEEYDSGLLVKHKLYAFGKSISLNKKSREEDSDLLNYMFNGRK